MGGGGGGDTSTNEFKPPANTQAGWDQYIQNAMGMSGQPYSSSGIPTVAPFNDFQQTSQNLLYDRAINGAPDLNAGRAAVTGIASGNQANPWQSFLANTAAGGSQNPYMSGASAMAAGQNNPYMVDPEAMIKANAADMATAEQRGVGAQTDAAFNRSGAYGGSANQLMQSQNATDLAKATGTMAANTRMQANQQNAQTWQQQQQNKLAALGLGGGMYSTGLGQQLQAGTAGGQMFNSDINNMLSAAGLSGSLSNDDWTSIQNLMTGGNTYGAYQQALLNAGNQEFGNQQQWPYTQNELLGGALTRGSGQGGSSSVTQSGYSPYWNAAGVGAGLLGAYMGSKP